MKPMNITFLLLLWTLPVVAQTGTCGVQTGPFLPNLSVDRATLTKSIFSSFEYFPYGTENCVDSIGYHEVVRFTSKVPNLGKADLFIGDPQLCPSIYTCDPTTGRCKLKGSAAYRLWTPEGYSKWVKSRDLSLPITGTANEELLIQAAINGELISGHKSQYCWIDYSCAGKKCNSDPVFYRCDNQGLSIGWADEYRSSLNCQYIQVDNLLAGRYVLEVQVNPEQVLPESSYLDNSSAVGFQFSPCTNKRFDPSDPCVR